MTLPPDALTEFVDSLVYLKEMYRLNLELLEQLDVTCVWLIENHIPLPNTSTFTSLLTKAKSLLSEIQADEPKIIQYTKLADEKKHLFRTDDKEPVPFPALYKGAIEKNRTTVQAISHKY